jgi:hypothetical protein
MGSDGRWLFSAEFKPGAVRRFTNGEITATELSRGLGYNRHCFSTRSGELPSVLASQ